MGALTRHLMMLEDQRMDRMRIAFEKKSTPESRKALREFLDKNKKNPMEIPPQEVREEMDRIL